jgi:hypothetical protein
MRTFPALVVRIARKPAPDALKTAWAQNKTNFLAGAS